MGLTGWNIGGMWIPAHHLYENRSRGKVSTRCLQRMNKLLLLLFLGLVALAQAGRRKGGQTKFSKFPKFPKIPKFPKFPPVKVMRLCSRDYAALWQELHSHSFVPTHRVILLGGSVHAVWQRG